MRLSALPALLCVSLTTQSSFAQVQKMTPEQFRVSLCEQAAGSKKGSGRQAFLRSCMMPRTEAPMPRASGCEYGSRQEDL